MPRTREQLEQALAETEVWLDQLSPETIASPGSDASDLRAIGDALRAVAASDLSLADQVAKARANGRTWTQIAAVLGVSKQAAGSASGASTPIEARAARSPGAGGASACASLDEVVREA